MAPPAPTSLWFGHCGTRWPAGGLAIAALRARQCHPMQSRPPHCGIVESGRTSWCSAVVCRHPPCRHRRERVRSYPSHDHYASAPGPAVSPPRLPAHFCGRAHCLDERLLHPTERINHAPSRLRHPARSRRRPVHQKHLYFANPHRNQTSLSHHPLLLTPHGHLSAGKTLAHQIPTVTDRCSTPSGRILRHRLLH